jgi:hypothetical protein
MMNHACNFDDLHTAAVSFVGAGIAVDGQAVTLHNFSFKTTR